MKVDQVLSFFKSNWLVQKVAPVVSFVSPPVFSKNISRRPSIIINIVDAVFGIDPDSIVLYVNHHDATEASVISSIENGFEVLYEPLFDFYWGSRVIIMVRAANNIGQYMDDFEFYFSIVSRKITSMVDEAVLDIARVVDWSELE